MSMVRQSESIVQPATQKPSVARAIGCGAKQALLAPQPETIAVGSQRSEQ